MLAAPTPTARAREARARGALHVLLVAGLALAVLRPLCAPPGVPAVPRPLAIDLALDPPARLALLPGVGPQRAAALAAHRAEHGPPRSLEELAAVPGLGAARAQALLATPRVRVRCRGQPLSSRHATAAGDRDEATAAAIPTAGTAGTPAR